MRFIGEPIILNITILYNIMYTISRSRVVLCRARARNCYGLSPYIRIQIEVDFTFNDIR